LIRAPLSTTSVLDDAAEIVTMTLPWAALQIATAIPYRLLQALFFEQLLEVGAEASKYGNLLGMTANMIVGTVLLALWGRTVQARACRLASARGEAPGREALSVPAPALASYVLTASSAILAGYLALPTILGFLAAVMFAGAAIGTFELNDRVSLTRPFALMIRHSKSIRIPFALVLVFLCATAVAWVNVLAAFQLVASLASSVGNFDAPGWSLLFTNANRRFVLMTLAGALLIVEPFWIAAQVLLVRKAGAEETGDDLRTWFEELQRAS
jgi:hypothetical protein